jgi:hypothetical protein
MPLPDVSVMKSHPLDGNIEEVLAEHDLIPFGLVTQSLIFLIRSLWAAVR